MKKFLFATFMGALVALVGCQQNDELTGVENTLGKKVSVTANIKANAQSRVAMEYVTGADGGSTIKVEWKESGEEFKMYDATDDTKSTMFSQTSGNQFEGTLPSESGSYYAVYGNDANLANQDGTLKEDYVWMKSDDITDLTQSIEFNHLTTVLMPNFIIENKNVNASITQIVMDGVPSSNGTITITPPQEDDTTTPSQEDDIFIFLPASNGEIEAETPFNFTVTKDGKEYVAELSISKSMIAGQFYNADIHLEEKTIPYVTFTADAEQTLSYQGSDLQYSTDGTTFQALPANTPITFGGNTKLYLRGVNNLDGNFYESEGYTYGYQISFGNDDVPVACTGDIRTLIDYKTYKTVDTSNATFISLFEDCTELTSAPALPATTLADYCYASMFYGCEKLTEAPELPATTLAQECYSCMFSHCYSLTDAPALPATTLADYCYASMFYGCEKLTEAPELPATTLADNCYEYMFHNCTSLTDAPALPATTLAEACYLAMFYGCISLTEAPELPATTLAAFCYQSMFNGCSSLKEAPALPATTLADYCYLAMFFGCTSLEEAPELPATTLAESCYRKMFEGCTSLNKITMLATNISATDCLKDWVKGVPATGTLTKAASMTSLPTGKDGIPENWTVVDKP